MVNKAFVRFALLSLVALMVSGGACPSNDTTPSNKVEQTEIYQDYSVTLNGKFYDATAYFRVGGKTGTTLALVAPSKVTLNGQPMTEHLNTMSGTYYTGSVPVSTEKGTFAFTDRNNKVYTNEVVLMQSALQNVPAKVNGAKAISVPLDRPLADSATLNLKLNDRSVFIDPNNDATTEAFFDKANNSIVLYPATWRDVPGGNFAMSLNVKDATVVKEGTKLGGEIRFEYDTQPVNLSVTKPLAKAAVTKKKSGKK